MAQSRNPKRQNLERNVMTDTEYSMNSNYTLITGASGYIGSALAQTLATKQQVICLSRKKTQGDFISIQGEFHAFEDLRQLDGVNLSCVVHLAAVTGGCSEEEGLAINVQGTRRLLRYALDRGCRKFVLASSIAATGCLSDTFIPLHLPISEEHPCLAEDAYGLSKAMMEDVTHYFQRLFPDSDFINLRIGLVNGTQNLPPQHRVGDPLGLPFVNLAYIMLGDVLRALECAVTAPHQSGVGTFNVVGPDTNCVDSVSAILRSCLGERGNRLDFSRFDASQHQFDALYSMDKIKDALGFCPEESTRLRVCKQCGVETNALGETFFVPQLSCPLVVLSPLVKKAVRAIMMLKSGQWLGYSC